MMQLMPLRLERKTARVVEKIARKKGYPSTAEYLRSIVLREVAAI